MMSDPAVQAEHVGKQYRIGMIRSRHRTLREALTHGVQQLARDARLRLLDRAQNRQRDDCFWALRDVSFEVDRGEVVGIIGGNGAGKSTLLKILSRITEPTTGHVEIRGRVGSLLEVGTGFHPELTGRENIYLNGAILGMRRAEINRKFDEIVAFAEVDRFIDTPVKHYSSGMHLRLAFAVAAHLEPEILLVDEVLAVGDTAFQKKCLGKMNSVAKEGRTILFVSHNMSAVQSLCERVVWLDRGGIRGEGSPAEVVSRYLKASSSSLAEQEWTDAATAPGNDLVRLRRVCIRPKDGSPSDSITTGIPIVLEIEFWNLMPDTDLNLNIQLITEDEVVAFTSVSIREQMWRSTPFSVGLFRSECHIPADLLNAFRYRIRLRVVKDRSHVIHQQDDVLVFDVQESPDFQIGWYGKMQGAVRPLLQWHTHRVAEKSPVPARVRR